MIEFRLDSAGHRTGSGSSSERGIQRRQPGSGIWAIPIDTGERRQLTRFVTKSDRADHLLGDASRLCRWMAHPGVRPGGE